eukprot:12363182-Alexandrium_andersonii.AAC.1
MCAHSEGVCAYVRARRCALRVRGGEPTGCSARASTGRASALCRGLAVASLRPPPSSAGRTERCRSLTPSAGRANISAAKPRVVEALVLPNGSLNRRWSS